MASTRHTEQQWSATAGELRYRGIRPGYAVLHVATGGAIGIAAFVALTSLLSLTLGLLPTVVGAAISGALLLGVNSALSAVHRSRMRSFLVLHITAPAPMSGDRLVSRLRRVLTTAPLWKSLAYNAIVGLLLFVLGVVVVTSLAAGLVCVTAPIFGTPVSLGSWGLSTQSPFSVAGAVVIGTMLVLAVPPMARAVAYADARIAIALLGRARTEELVQRVEHLAQARTGTVDAADAERRRIERDLHDGTQQRLTALAMNLGVARATLPDLSPSAQAALDQAHAEAKEALVELRGIVRGLHPAVLDDRGLDAALSGLAARSPIPVSLDVVVPQRLPRPVEAVAYFVVSEALTNVVKHSGAGRAQVTARLVDGRLHLRVVDDGTGGADPTRGSGLVGLRQRVASVDGDLTIESPLGGPTVLEAVIPCAL